MADQTAKPTEAQKKAQLMKAIKKLLPGAAQGKALSDDDIRRKLKGNSVTSGYRKPQIEQ